MAQYIRRFVAPLALGTALFLGACSKDEAKDGLTSDSALSRDLALAGQDTGAQPQLQDIPSVDSTPLTTPAGAASPAAPVTRTPARTTTRTPARTPARTSTSSGTTSGTSGGGAVGTIASGTTLSLTSAAKVCTNTNQVGDTFTAEVAQSVTGSNGATIPAGSVVTLRTTNLKRSENVNSPIVMEFEVVSVRINGTTYALNATTNSADVTRVRSTTRKTDAQKVVGGAVVGAIAGQVLGKNTKSTVIGAAAGAAAGAGVAAATANYDGCINDGAAISVTLNSSVQVKV